MLAIVWIAGGATCYRGQRLSDFNPPPVVFETQPRIEEVIAAVNRTDTITMMQSTSTTVELLNSPVPRLNASLALERPRRFRLRASLPILLGASLDVGSNDELFWMRYPDDGVRQTLLYARHDQFQPQMPGSPLAVDPTWLIEALGLVHIDPNLVQQGPTPRGDGQLELRTRVPTPGGDHDRVLLIDAKRGFVVSQYLYGPNGRLVASATGSEHEYYEEQRVVLPHSVEIHLAASGGSPPVGLQVEVGSYALNQLLGEDPRQFEIPSEGNHQVVDLSRLAGPVTPPPLERGATAAPAPGSTAPGSMAPGATIPGGGGGSYSPAYPPGAASPYRPPPTDRAAIERPHTERNAIAPYGVAPNGVAPHAAAPNGGTWSGQRPAAAPVEPVRQYVPTAAFRPTLRGTERR